MPTGAIERQLTPRREARALAQATQERVHERVHAAKRELLEPKPPPADRRETPGLEPLIGTRLDVTA